MKVEFHGRPAYTMAVCYLDADESIRVESGALATMSASIEASFDVGPGGVARGVMRKVLGGESFFMGRYTARVQGAWVGVSPRYPGDITVVDVDPSRPLVAESGSLLAVTEGVDVDVRWAGARSILMQEGATMLKFTGHGVALLCSYGAIVEQHLGYGQELVVDTGHLVAYETSAQIRVGPIGGLTSSAASGEGLVARLTGGEHGSKVWVQTRAERDIRNWLMPQRKQNKQR